MTDETQRHTGFGERIMNVVEAVVSWGSGLALLGATLTIFFNASGRYLIGWSFLGGEELARLLTVWITFVGTFVLVRREGHVNIDLLLRAVGPRMQRLFRGTGALIGILVMIYLVSSSYDLTAFSFGSGQMGTTLPVPRGLFFLPVLVGAVLMMVAFAEIFLRAITDTLPPLVELGTDADEQKADF
jgi:TRAP-type C4-dicarboxylate transport system permease small subunit